MAAENDPKSHCVVPGSGLLLAKFMRMICHSGDKAVSQVPVLCAAIFPLHWYFQADYVYRQR